MMNDEKLSSDQMTLYPINDIYTCIQGEGGLTGMAMVLLRLHGCAVGCPWCDTQETWHFLPDLEGETLADVMGTNGRFINSSAGAIVDYIVTNHPGPRWVLVTGGEPAQYRLAPLVARLHAAGYKVAIETSGTEVGHVGAQFDWVCVSPKIDMPGGKSLQTAAFEAADEIKQVVGRQRDIDQLDQLLAQLSLKPTCDISLQPLSISQKATRLCIETVQERGWRLSIQTHKLLGVR